MSEDAHHAAPPGGGAAEEATTGAGSPSRAGGPPPNAGPNRLLQVFLWLSTVSLVFYLLVIGQALIIPLVLAFFAWYLINTLNKLTRSIRVGEWRPPRWLAFTLSAVLVVGVLLGLALLIRGNVNQVQAKAPEYRQRVVQIADQMQSWLPAEVAESLRLRARSTPPGDDPPDAPDSPDSPDAAAPAEPVAPSDALALAADAGAGADAEAGSRADADAASPTSAPGAPLGADAGPGAAKPTLASRLRTIDFTGILQSLAATLGSFAGSAAMVLAYLFFIFLEQRFFEAKLRMLVKDPQRRRHIESIIAEIDRDIRSYIGVKTLVSALTAALSYLIMKIAGLDFAEFWAVLLFIFNYIPNVGSLIATVLPAGLAIVQLDLAWFLVVTLGITAVQLAMANLVEPNLMGKSLNQSPLVVILSLVLWGTLWGVAGMFLCVPITVVVMIVLSHFPQTRWVPVLLSLDGRVRGDPDVRRSECE